MDKLPACRWKGLEHRAKVECFSRRRTATAEAPVLVSHRLCQRCYMRDHAPTNGETPPAAEQLEARRAALPIVTREPWTARTTACISHWRRPNDLARLVAALREKWPDLRILTEDTGGNVSRARNNLAARCPTPYYLMLEEDFVPNCSSELEQLAEVLDTDKDISGAAGWTIEPTKDGTVNRGDRAGRISWCRDFRRQGDRIYLAPGQRGKRTTPGGVGYKPCEIVLNFGIFRRELFEAVPWDNALEIHEHDEYFYRAAMAGHLFAYVPTVGISHYRNQADPTYRKARARRFNQAKLTKHGALFVHDAGKLPQLDRPNVLVLGIGKSNTTITARQIAALGWNAEPVVDYFESQPVSEANFAAYRNGYLPTHQARAALLRHQEPWVIKDPKMRDTLGKWLPHLERYRPFLLYVTKEPDQVKASLRKQGWDGRNAVVEARTRNAERFYEQYPYPKLKLAAETIAQAMALFDPSRMSYALAKEGQQCSETTSQPNNS